MKVKWPSVIAHKLEMVFIMKYVVVLGLLVFQSSEAAKILGIYMMPSYSHFTLGNRLMRELALKGHEVTYVSPFKDKNPPKGYRDVTLIGLVHIFEDMKKDLNMYDMQFMPLLVAPLVFANITLTLTEETLSNPSFQELIHSNATFDLIIQEAFFNEALRGLQHHYKAPLILTGSIGPSSFINYQTLNPSPSSYIPNWQLAYSKREMNFWMRMTNFLFNMYEEMIIYWHQFPKQNELLQKYFPGAPNLYDLIYDNPIILLNTHISTYRPVPITSNMIEIGGYHVYPSKKLPQHLQKYLDDAKEGVIMFSMGSNLKSAEMTPEKRDAFLKAFAKLKQKVLWKWEDETLPGQPANVKLEKWLPQQDILPHPNIKLFITHGGLLSTTEAIYHGVPVVGIPIFGDQQINMGLAEVGGYGKAVFYGDLSEEALTTAINEVLFNPKYKENAKRRQQLLHDRPMSPIDTAVWWIEYVLRNPESDFHRSPAIDLKWYQLYLLDVIAFLGFVCLLGLFSIIYIIKKLCCRSKGNRQLNQVKKNK